MTEIIKAKVLIIRKVNFGDTSNILNVFSEDSGKYSVIIKGARSSKSKNALAADVLNVVEIVIYRKENRDTQLVSQVDLIKSYVKIKDDLSKLKYAFAVCELLQNLIFDNEPHSKLFRGTMRILDLMEANNQIDKFLFAKYFLFFIEEIGFKINLNECATCNKNLSHEHKLGVNFEKGFLCENCSNENYVQKFFDSELFNLLACLSTKKNEVKYTELNIDTIIEFLEKYLCYHVQEFKGIQSLKIY